MLTDDDRRRVAERLRAYGREFGDPTWRELCNVVFWDEDRYPTTVRKLHLIDRLADLIDPGESGHESGQNRDTVQQESPAVQKAPECDREALLALALEIKRSYVFGSMDADELVVSRGAAYAIARRIYDACLGVPE